MNNRIHTILIAGVGQLGSRYLQGLSQCRSHLRIHLYDISSESLSQAEQRWQEVYGPSTHHDVYFSTEIQQCPQQLDLAIVATTANSRPEVIRQIAQRSSVRCWILEKVLAQSAQGLAQILSYVGTEASAWVNTPRRCVPWHQAIKDKLHLQSPLHMTVTGGSWGLACNALHFLDLMAWWSGETLVSINTEQLDDCWFKAKRAGNWEICGTLVATYTGGATVKLTSVKNGGPSYFYEIADENCVWRIDEENGSAVSNDGAMILGHLPYQSEMTTALVDRILETGDCKLPTLSISIDIHRVFVDALFNHWHVHQDSAATSVPIT